MSLNLRQLKLFEATARLGRLTHAADEQAISQSAASQAIKELESHLGYPLFQRVGRELNMTPAAHDVLPRVIQIIELTDSLKAPEAKSLSGILRIAASVTIANYLLPELVAEFLADHPLVTPDIAIANTYGVIEAVERGQAHLGLIEGPALHRQLTITHWRDDALQVFCAPDHPLASQGRIDADEVATQRWILREDGSGTRLIFDAAVQQIKQQVKVAFALNRQEAIKRSVRAGLGIGCLSRLSIAEEVERGELVVIETPLELSRRLSIVAQPSASTNPLVETFEAFIQRSSSNL